MTEHRAEAMAGRKERRQYAVDGTIITDPSQQFWNGPTEGFDVWPVTKKVAA